MPSFISNTSVINIYCVSVHQSCFSLFVKMRLPAFIFFTHVFFCHVAAAPPPIFDSAFFGLDAPGRPTYSTLIFYNLQIQLYHRHIWVGKKHGLYEGMLKSSLLGPLSQITISLTEHLNTDFVKLIRLRTFHHVLLQSCRLSKRFQAFDGETVVY